MGLRSRLRNTLKRYGLVSDHNTRLRRESRQKPWGLLNILILSSLILFCGTVMLGTAFVGFKQFKKSDYYIVHFPKPAATTQPTYPQGSVIVREIKRDTRYLAEAEAKRRQEAAAMQKFFNTSDKVDVYLPPISPAHTDQTTSVEP